MEKGSVAIKIAKFHQNGSTLDKALLQVINLWAPGFHWFDHLNPPEKRGVLEHRKNPFWQAFQISSLMWPLKGIHLVQLRETSFVQAKMEVFLSCESSKKYPWKCTGYTRHVISLSISYACNDFLRSPQHLLWEFTFSTQGGSKKWPPILSRKPPHCSKRKQQRFFTPKEQCTEDFLG